MKPTIRSVSVQTGPISSLTLTVHQESEHSTVVRGACTAGRGSKARFSFPIEALPEVAQAGFSTRLIINMGALTSDDFAPLKMACKALMIEG